MMSEIRSKKNI